MDTNKFRVGRVFADRFFGRNSQTANCGLATRRTKALREMKLDPPHLIHPTFPRYFYRVLPFLVN